MSKIDADKLFWVIEEDYESGKNHISLHRKDEANNSCYNFYSVDYGMELFEYKNIGEAVDSLYSKEINRAESIKTNVDKRIIELYDPEFIKRELNYFFSDEWEKYNNSNIESYRKNKAEENE